MREIKFRAWDKVLKDWIPGGKEFSLLGEAILHGGLFEEYSKDVYKRLYEDVVITQYTGLKDKNDIEIYEGDVIKQLGIKYYVNMTLGIWWGTRFKSRGQMELYLLLDAEHTAEVVGNIYENPKLIEK